MVVPVSVPMLHSMNPAVFHGGLIHGYMLKLILILSLPRLIRHRKLYLSLHVWDVVKLLQMNSPPSMTTGIYCMNHCEPAKCLFIALLINTVSPIVLYCQYFFPVGSARESLQALWWRMGRMRLNESMATFSSFFLFSQLSQCFFLHISKHFLTFLNTVEFLLYSIQSRRL